MCRTLDSKCGMLVRNNIVFVFWIQRLMLWWDIDLFLRQLNTRELLEQIGVVRFVEVNVGVRTVAGLEKFRIWISW